MCSYITYSIEPDITGYKSDNPMPIPPPKEVPVSIPHQSIDEGLNEALDQETAGFKKDIEEIVLKGIRAYFKNGGKGVVGIFIKELNSGFEYAYNAEITNTANSKEGYFNSASTCKLLSAAVMYYMNKCHQLDLDMTYTDKITNKQYNLKKLLPKMISHSVNDYFNITLRHLGCKQINEVLLKLGLKNSIVYSEIMPAQYSSVKDNIKR